MQINPKKISGLQLDRIRTHGLCLCELRKIIQILYEVMIVAVASAMSSCKLTRKTILGLQGDLSLPFFLHKLTSIHRQNWSCEEILNSETNDKAASFSSSVINIASSVYKVSYSKSLHNESRCSNTMTSFLTFKIINTRIFLYFPRNSENLLKRPVHGCDFVLLYIHPLAR